MDNLQRLISKAEHQGFRLLMRYDAEECGEEWCIKLYPEPDDNAHFYAFHSDLDQTAYKLLGEVDGESKW